MKLVAALSFLPMAGLGLFAAPTSQSSAKVESQLLLGPDGGDKFFLSPRGQHVAAIVLRGSRQVVVYDGVDGPKFDEVMPQSITFSPDGKRYGYLAREGQEYVYMVDGKELVRLPAASVVYANAAAEFPLDTGSNGTTAPTFTSNSRHVYFLVRTKAPGKSDVATFYFDGKPGATRATDPPLVPAISPDGDHFAYIHSYPAGAQQPALIVDGNQAAWQGGNPRWTGDSKHLVTSRLLTGGVNEVQIDGKPWIRAADVRLFVAPAGDRVIAAVKATPQSNGWFLHMGAQKVPGSDAQDVSNVYFSDDGKHWAANCQTASGSRFMLIDGKKGLEYQNVQAIGFTPDGRFVYKATIAGNKQLIVHGDQESDAFQSIITSMTVTRPRSGSQPIYADNAVLEALIEGNRVGFLANRTFSGDSSVVVIDGKATAVKSPKELTFSSDGSRHAIMFGSPSSAVQVMVDGTQHTGMIHGPVVNAFEKRFAFSPDGKHIAYAASSADGRVRGISVDGKFIPYAQLVAFPMHNITFTPDGKHILWLAGLSGTRSAVYVDGVPAVMFNHNGLAMTQSSADDRLEMQWSMGADGVLTFIGEDEAGLKRFRVTPDPDTSIDTLLKMSSLRFP